MTPGLWRACGISLDRAWSRPWLAGGPAVRRRRSPDFFSRARDISTRHLPAGLSWFRPNCCCCLRCPVIMLGEVVPKFAQEVSGFLSAAFFPCRAACIMLRVCCCVLCPPPALPPCVPNSLRMLCAILSRQALMSTASKSRGSRAEMQSAYMHMQTPRSTACVCRGASVQFSSLQA